MPRSAPDVAPDPRIREATPGDAESLAALAIAVWLHTYATEGVSPKIARYVLATFGADRFRTLLADPQRRLLVAESDDHLVGYAQLRVDIACPVAGPADVELETLYVQAHFAGAGIGARLLRRCEAAAGARGRLWLTVNARNERAIAFYARQGYERIGRDDFDLEGELHENHVLVASER